MITQEHPHLADGGPLAWVMVEIREALGRSKTALFQAGGRRWEERATALRHAKSHLHQAHGALQIVDIDGVALLTDAAERALDRFKDGTLECSVDHAQVVADLYQALLEYLEELLGGAAPQPVRLFPYYRAVQEMLGERCHPADLFFPDLQAASADAAVGAAPPSADAGASPASTDAGVPFQADAPAGSDDAAARQRFEKALLAYLKSADSATQSRHAATLHQTIAEVAAARRAAPARAFWDALACFAGLVAGGQLASDRYVKQLFGAINLQLRKLTEGAAALPDTMLRDALFFIAAAAPAPDAALPLRRAYRLDGMVPPDYQRSRYGQLDPATLARARQDLAQAKAHWERLAAADGGAAPGADCGALLTRVAQAADALKSADLALLLRQLAQVAQAPRGAGRGDELEMEMATALLFAEHGLQQLRRLPDDFAANAETIVARLQALQAGEAPPAPSQWQGQLSRQIAQEQTVSAVAVEMKTSLRQVEKVLDEYYTAPSTRPALLGVDAVLHQLEGALALLGQQHAAQGARQVRGAVRRLAQALDDPAGEPKALDDIAQNVGALGFFVDLLGHNVDAARERFQFDPSADTFRAISFEKIAAADPVPLLDQALAPAAPAAPAAAPDLLGDAAVAAELLAVFVDEAREVLAFVDATLALPRRDSVSPDRLTMLRRSFQTLKGSARMVGLAAFAAAAGSVERVLNVWLGDGRAVTDAVPALLRRGAAELGAWLAELADGAASGRDAEALVEAAQQVLDAAASERDAAPPAAEAAGKVIDFPTLQAPPPERRDDHLKRVGELAIALPLYNTFLAETDQLLRLLEQDCGEWRHESQRAVSGAALHAAHTLAGISATVGFDALSALGGALEAALEARVPPARELAPAQYDLLERALGCVRRMLKEFALGELAPAEPDLVAALRQLRADLLPPPAAPEDQLAQRLDALFAAAHRGIVGQAARSAPEADPASAPADRAEDRASGTEAVPARAAEAGAAASRNAAAERDLAVRLDALFAVTYRSIVAAPDAAPRAAALPRFADAAAVDDFDDLFGAAGAGLAPSADRMDAAAGTHAAGAPAFPFAACASAPPAPAEPAPAEPPLPDVAPVDELDPDLLPVFLDEGADLLPRVGQAVRAWRQDPADSAHAQALLRALHTVKGSARMAGAMRLGQHVHEIESHIADMLQAGRATDAAFEQLQSHDDHAQHLFEQLQRPDALGAAPAPPSGPVRATLVRVRADLLDRLLNQAGDVSIAGARLESGVGALQSSLGEFADNLTRLRRQLREVEAQTAAQIGSRMAIASEREFDPQEFDRLTRLQELTRMMAESVADAAAFHRQLSDGVGQAGAQLARQARLTRDLQDDLLRVRMVPFDSIAERLFRVARQSAKETGKRVNLELQGGEVELDRAVLERITAPFEHLLRNAIVHGIESRRQRHAAAKSEVGELLVRVSRQGNQVVLELRDDGAGLDLERLRAKARECGLLGPGRPLSDAQAAALIFEPGLSTADTLTTLAGRGVGMDVVRSEAQALGGRVDVVSAPGQGTCFTLCLPVALATMQVVLVRCGGRSYALPTVLVGEVVQLGPEALAAARAAGGVAAHGDTLPLRALAGLLGGDPAPPPARRSLPLLLLRSGSERLALQVEQVLGSREVALKPVAPQWQGVVGLAGATLLGTGELVPILNPLALAHHLDHRPELAAQYAAALGAPAVAAPEHTIVVVDDSVSARSALQRLLERDGYRVRQAGSGEAAWELLQGERPDLLLIDIEMAGMDGLALARQLRADARTRALPLVLLSARSAERHRDDALALGVDAYLAKPCADAALLAAVAGLLRQGAAAPDLTTA